MALQQMSYAEENYLKAIDTLSGPEKQLVSTTALATQIGTTPAAVTDMIQRLHRKELVIHKRYQGVQISPLGKKKSVQIIRRQCLWELFLIKQFQLTPEAAAAAAEELEHVHSEILIEKIDEYLGHPSYTLTGKPIPDAKGYTKSELQLLLDQLNIDVHASIIAFKDNSPVLLEYLHKRNIRIGTTIKILDKLPFDQSVEIAADGSGPITLSAKTCSQILVVPC